MFVLKALIICAAWLTVQSQHNGPTTTPVPILKQINKQNDDGSYSYGYEAADGSFKIETKYPNGDVAGKYGYVDESGKLKEISYGASSARGFEPQGSGIVVPPPTLNDPSNALTEGQEDDGQYREDPKIYEDPKYNGRQATRPVQQTFKQFHQPSQPKPEPQFQQYQSSFQSSFQPAQAQQYQPQSYQQYQPEPVQQYQPQQVQQYQPQPIQQYQPQPIQQYRPEPAPLRPTSQFSQQTNLFNQAPQQFPQERPQSQVYHQQPQFSYQAYTPQPYSQFQGQAYQNQNYQTENYSPFGSHPAQNFDPNTGSYTINYTG